MHRIARINLCLSMLFSLLHCQSQAEETLHLDRVLDNHFEAMGGAESLKALCNIKLRLKIWEADFEVEGLYRASADGQVRIDIFAGSQRVFSEGIDENGGWQQNGEASEVLGMSEEGLLALQRGIQRNLAGLMGYSTQEGNARLRDRQTLAGVDYVVLETTEWDGSRQLFINPDSWLVERSREIKALHPDADATELSTEELHSDFRPLCGVLRSYKSENHDLATEELIQSTEIIEAHCNIDRSELGLARPKAA